MEIKGLLKDTLLILLVSAVHGQNSQLSNPKFIPNLFNTIQATMEGFSPFSYLQRPLGPFPATRFRPGDVNQGYPQAFVQSVPQQSVIRFTGPTRHQQNIPILTSMRDEIRQQMSKRGPNNRVIGRPPSKANFPPPPLTTLPLAQDNRNFHNVRYSHIQPPSIVSPENSKKEILVEKFHKPVRSDAAFQSNNVRKPLPSFESQPALNKAYAGHNAQTPVTNTRLHDVSLQAQPTRVVQTYVGKDRSASNNFRPLSTPTKQLPIGKPNLRYTAAPYNPPQSTITESDREEAASENFVKTALNGDAVVSSASTSHSIYVKIPAGNSEKPETLKEEMPPQLIPSSQPEIVSTVKEETEVTTENLNTVTEESAVSVIHELPSESPEENSVTESPISEEPKENENTASVETISENKKELLDETSLSNQVFGENNVLTGTPEEILSLKLVDAINNFGFQLYHKLEKPKNLFFSPLSLSAALAIILEGTSNMTAVQMMNVLHFSESNIRPDEVKIAFKRLMKSLKSKRSDYQFENANLLLLKSKFFFKSDFSNNVYRNYKPLLGSVDFAANGLNIKRSVNDWVKRRTHDKIEQFLTEPLPKETVFAVLNAVYFRGQWIQPFDTALTGPGLFYNYGKEPVEIAMMKQTASYPVGYSSDLNAQIIELPYEGEETSMVIVLPEERDGIYQLRQKLYYQELYVILRAIDFYNVQLILPRFSLQSKYDMEDVLKEMGMKDMFSARKANFGRMTNVTGLYVSNVVHEGVIDVDEKGTEAVASTRGVVVQLSRPQRVIVDHPFFFFIRNRNNGAILFIGQFDSFDE